MESNHKSRQESLISGFISILFLLFFLYCTYLVSSLYESRCPNKDFLTWDPELRYIITLKMMNHLREGKIFHVIGMFLDSPHWPSLRNVLESIIFLISNHSPDMVVKITYFFFQLIPISILIFLYRTYPTNLTLSLVYGLFIFCLLQNDALWLYSLTGMLEVQGAFLFPFVGYIVWKSINDPKFIENKKNGWVSFIVCFLLYQTKYPYGYLLVLFLVLYAVFFLFDEVFLLMKNYLFTLRSPQKKSFLFLGLALLLSFLLFKNLLTGKVPGYLLYLSILLIVSDFFIHFFQSTKHESDTRITFIIRWILFPIIFWILIQPDRFGSYSGQITHEETQGFNPGQKIERDLDYYLVFFTEFLLNAYSNFHVSYFIFIFWLYLSLRGVISLILEKKINFSFFLSLISLVTFLELSLFTSNRLARHTYHLYPSMVLSIGIYLLELSSKYPFRSSSIASLVLGIIAFPFSLDPIHSLGKKEICYTGYDTTEYLTPKWFEEKGKKILEKNTIIFNEVNPLHVNKADTEYILTKISYDKKIRLLFDPKRKSQIQNEFDEVWIVGNECKESKRFQEFKPLFQDFKFKTESIEEIKSDLGCIRIFKKL